MIDTPWDNLWRKELEKPIAGPDEALWLNDIDHRKLKFIRQHAPESGVATEVGCGSARLLALVGHALPGLRLIAVDESNTALELASKTARSFSVSIETRRGDVRELPLESESVDLIMSGGLLEHFPDPHAVLGEMLRVLRPGGTVYADVVPRKMSLFRWRERVRMRESEWIEPGVYESDLGPSEYEAAFRRLGCRSQFTSLWCGVYPSSIRYLGPVRPLAARMAEILDGSTVAERWGWYFMFAIQKST